LTYRAILDKLLKKTQSPVKGHIGFSPEKKNSIISNHFGAAVFHGHLNALKWISSHDTKVDIEFKAEEKPSIEGRALRKEVTGYTPLMLAIMRGDSNLMIIKYLVDTLKCNVKAKDNFGNTVVHLAVKYGCEEIVKYFVKEKKMEAFDRNFEGKAAVITAREKGFVNIESIFTQLDGSADKVLFIHSLIDPRTNKSE